VPTCKGCGREINWVKTLNGKNMPVDPEPQTMVVTTKNDKAWVSKTCYVPHWATCPNADDFRKREEKKEQGGVGTILPVPPEDQGPIDW